MDTGGTGGGAGSAGGAGSTAAPSRLPDRPATSAADRA